MLVLGDLGNSTTCNCWGKHIGPGRIRCNLCMAVLNPLLHPSYLDACSFCSPPICLDKEIMTFVGFRYCLVRLEDKNLTDVHVLIMTKMGNRN
jgi:hypothetical protein